MSGMSQRLLVPIPILVAAAALVRPVTAQAAGSGPEARPPVQIPLDRADHLLSRLAAATPDRRRWEARARALRTHLLVRADLEPAPRRTPLRPIRRARFRGDGYTVENVAFESVPGVFETGNLYLPDPAPGAGSAPAVLCPHGHFQDARVRRDMQIRCAMFARMGAVCWAWDMVGWGDATQTGHGKEPRALTLQLWNALRAVDFVTSLPEVDDSRIGVTGASGGGTQTFLLTAVDSRITASAPVVMVSAHFRGGCNCESGLPIHFTPRTEASGNPWRFHTNNVEFAALAAPRPQLVVSCGGDWTKRTPEVEFPYLRRIYRQLGVEDRVANAHFPAEGHDYGPNKRAAVYAFFGRQLRLAVDRGRDPDGRWDESRVTIRPAASLRVFDQDHPRPSYAAADGAAACAAFDAARRPRAADGAPAGAGGSPIEDGRTP